MNERTVIPTKFAVYQVGHNPYTDTDFTRWDESDLTYALVLMNRIGKVNDNDLTNKWGDNGIKFSPFKGIKVTIIPEPSAWLPGHAILKICDDRGTVLLVGTTYSMGTGECVDTLILTTRNGIPATVFVRIWW